jgi:PKD repeat protein
MKDVTIDFGDGQSQAYALNTTHRYAKPGVYKVTVRGQDSGSGPGVFHVRVFVD